MLTDLMGGELTRQQHAGRGLGLPRAAVPAAEVHARPSPRARGRRSQGAARLRRAARRILVVDNEEADRELLVACWSRSASSCAPPPAATTRSTCWPPACSPTPS
jgi:hypothetical protein